MSINRRHHPKKIERKNILYLNLKREYFDKILAREKLREYRNNTPYYHSRIGQKRGVIKYIWFMNGMHANARQMLVVCEKIQLNRQKYILYLGAIISADPKQIKNLRLN